MSEIETVSGDLPSDELPAKKCKIITNNVSLEAQSNGHDKSETPSHNSRTLEIVKVLRHDSRHKCITLHAKFPFENDKADAIVVLDKAAFPSDAVTLLDALRHPVASPPSSLVMSAKEVHASPQEWWWKPVMHNDVYHKYTLMFPPSGCLNSENENILGNLRTQLSEMKATVIHPASEKHLERACSHQFFLIKETAETYNQITRPHFMDQQFSLSWVYNVLDGVSEVERVIYRHTDTDGPGNGFIVVQDYKWDGRLLEELYCLLIVEDRSLHSIRDLRGDKHLILLKAMLSKGRQAVSDKYGIEKSQLRCYFHYQPTFYHLHVHIVPMNTECVSGVVVGRAHLLQDVIARLEEQSDYYEKATLYYQVADNDTLFEKLRLIEGVLD